jgi:hypothetical protein
MTATTYSERVAFITHVRARAQCRHFCECESTSNHKANLGVSYRVLMPRASLYRIRIPPRPHHCMRPRSLASAAFAFALAFGIFSLDASEKLAFALAFGILTLDASEKLACAVATPFTAFPAAVASRHACS